MEHGLHFRDAFGNELWLVDTHTALRDEAHRRSVLPRALATAAVARAPVTELRAFLGRSVQYGRRQGYENTATEARVYEFAQRLVALGWVSVLRAPTRDSLGGVSNPQEAEDETDDAPPPPPRQDLVWIEIELIDEADRPVPRAEYEVTLADHTVVRGRLDGEGRARIENIPRGQCDVVFPRLDRDAWQKI